MTDLTHVLVREGATLRQVLEAMTRSGEVPWRGRTT